MNDLQELIHTNAHNAFGIGVRTERERIIKLLIANNVLRLDALGSLVFINCDTLAVEYLPESLVKGEQK